MNDEQGYALVKDILWFKPVCIDTDTHIYMYAWKHGLTVDENEHDQTLTFQNTIVQRYKTTS